MVQCLISIFVRPIIAWRRGFLLVNLKQAVKELLANEGSAGCPCSYEIGQRDDRDVWAGDQCGRPLIELRFDLDKRLHDSLSMLFANVFPKTLGAARSIWRGRQKCNLGHE